MELENGVHLFRVHDMPAVDRGSGITTIPLAGRPVGAIQISSGITSFPPGAAIALHTHDAEECVVVIEGEAVFEANGELHDLRPFEATFVPAGVPHRFKNGGAGQMRILWTYGSTNPLRTFLDPDGPGTINSITAG